MFVFSRAFQYYPTYGSLPYSPMNPGLIRKTKGWDYYAYLFNKSGFVLIGGGTGDSCEKEYER